MKLSVIGTGYVGLVCGACFADMGHEVTCVDVVKEKIDALNAGKIPIYEPGLEHLVNRGVKEKRLFFTTDIAAAVARSQAVFIAVGTPPGADGSADLKYVLQVAETIGKNLIDYKVVVTKSTVPVGTAQKVREAAARFAKSEFDVVSNPEFLKEGAAIDDFMRPDRVVIGVESERAKKVMEELYAPFLRNSHPIYFMDVKSAEMTKYAANAMLAVRISFMNEIANLCDSVGADVTMVRKGIGSDKRIGMPFLYPGIGYGGSCFPKDVKALIRTAEDHRHDFSLLKAVDEVNEKQKTVLVEKMRDYFKGKLKGKVVALWGLAFKPETDDIREAPSLRIIEELLASGALIRASDPEAIGETRKLLGDKVAFFEDHYECLSGADALVLATEWNEFRNPDWDKLRRDLKQPVIFDGRNIYRDIISGKGFDYFCIGSNLKK